MYHRQLITGNGLHFQNRGSHRPTDHLELMCLGVVIVVGFLVLWIAD